MKKNLIGMLTICGIGLWLAKDKIKVAVMDKISQQRIKNLHPEFRPMVEKFLQEAAKAGISLRITEGIRSFATQAKYYAQGRTAPGAIITNAKPGSSPHQYGLAVDVVEMDEKGNAVWDNPNWPEIGRIGKSVGMTWGGDFKSLNDRPHFEWTGGLTVSQLHKKYLAGDFVNGFILLS